MDITIFLAQLWGPVVLAIGIGVFVSRNYYIRVYRDLEKDPLAVIVFGMIAMGAGIAQVLSHNMWDTLLQVVVSILGWGLLAKGVTFLVIPKVIDRIGDWYVRNKLLPVAGVLMLVAGGYLTWVAYFA